MFINPRSIALNREFGGQVYRAADGSWRATVPVQGGPQAVDPALSPVPAGTTASGDYHTHGNYSIVDAAGNVIATGDPRNDAFNSDQFSDGDRRGINATAAGKGNYRGYMIGPGGSVLMYNPETGEITVIFAPAPAPAPPPPPPAVPPPPEVE